MKFQSTNFTLHCSSLPGAWAGWLTVQGCPFASRKILNWNKMSYRARSARFSLIIIRGWFGVYRIRQPRMMREAIKRRTI